nr:hypothetical protein [Tanacetum cinerariifolium]
MSKSVEYALTPADFVVRNTVGKGSKQTTDGSHGFMLDERLQSMSRHRHASARRHASVKRASRDPDLRRKEARNLVRIYVACSSERQKEIKKEWDAADRANHRRPTLAREEFFSESENSGGGHWKSRPKKQKSNTDEEDLSQPLCEETNPFTQWIRL